MIKTFTTSAILVLAVSTICHSQITITAADMPVPSAPYNVEDIITAAPAQPTIGTSQNWNYGMYSSGNFSTVSYPVQTDAFFTANGVDVYTDGSKGFTSAFFYNLSTQYDFNANGIMESGVSVPLQGYDLSSITSSTNDSLVIPAQKYNFTTPKTVVQFPFTANSSWHSTSTRKTNFTLTVAAYFLNHTPAEHRYAVTRNDTIVAWGKLVVHTANGPSIAYDVLMDRSEQYARDSFYLAGSPAPLALLTAFGAAQGQYTDSQYAYNFYRKGSFSYLMRVYYGTDKTYTNKQGVYVNRDNVLAGVNDVKGASYSALIFPNPANSTEINIQLVGKTIASVSYVITDVTGKTVQAGTAATQANGMMKLPLNAELVNGNYFITLKDNASNEMVAEKIQLQR